MESTRRRMIFARGTVAPVASTTRPRIVPRVACAIAETDVIRQVHIKRIQKLVGMAVRLLNRDFHFRLPSLVQYTSIRYL